MVVKAKTREKKGGGAQIGVRLPAEVVQRLDSLRVQLSIPGVDLGRADVARAAILAGLDVLEKKHGRPAAK
jgi:hypothetical protein